MQNKIISQMTAFLAVALPCCLQAAWTTPVEINETIVDQPSLAVDGSGNAVAVWVGYNSTNGSNEIQSAARAFGGSWGSVQSISPAGYNAQYPVVCVDKNGNAVSVWSYYDGDNSRVQGATLPYGGSWTSPALISGAGQNADTPNLAMDSKGSVGNAVAVWHRFNGSNFIAQASVLPSGGSWSTPVNISPSGQDALSPNVAVDSNGNAVSTCLRSSDTGFDTRSCSLLEGQTWTPSYDLSSTIEPSGLGTVAVDTSGNAVAVWNEWDGSNYRIYFASLPYGGSWTAPSVISAAGQNAYTPLVTLDSLGNTFVIWVRYDGANYRLQASKRNVLGLWSTPATLSPSGQDVNNISLACNLLGIVVAAWDSASGGGSSVMSSVYTPVLGWSSAKTASNSGSYAYYPSVGMDALGNCVMIWLESTSTSMGIWGSTLPVGG